MAERLHDVGGGVTICAEAFGDAADPPLLLVMGLGMQMIRWHESLVRELTDAGLHVIRFDNRDSGRSTCFPRSRRRRRCSWCGGGSTRASTRSPT